MRARVNDSLCKTVVNVIGSSKFKAVAHVHILKELREVLRSAELQLNGEHNFALGKLFRDLFNQPRPGRWRHLSNDVEDKKLRRAGCCRLREQVAACVETRIPARGVECRLILIENIVDLQRVILLPRATYDDVAGECRRAARVNERANLL